MSPIPKTLACNGDEGYVINEDGTVTTRGGTTLGNAGLGVEARSEVACWANSLARPKSNGQLGMKAYGMDEVVSTVKTGGGHRFQGQG